MTIIITNTVSIIFVQFFYHFILLISGVLSWAVGGAGGAGGDVRGGGACRADQHRFQFGIRVYRDHRGVSGPT